MKLVGLQTKKIDFDLLFLFLIVLILGYIYKQTLLPGIGYMGDTAKFQFLGKIFGTPHATGYPTYLILNHFFVTLFKFGSLALRANFLSSVFTIGAAFLQYLALRQLSVKPIVTFSIVLAFCLGKTVWNQSIIAEVYSLNLLFVSAVTLFFIKWHLTKKDAYFYLACFFYAISFGNHLIMISCLPAIIYIVFVTNKKTFIDVKKILIVLFFILLGASQYYYLYWATVNPDTSYLEIKVTNLRDLFLILTGGQFKNNIFQLLSVSQLLAKIKKFGFFFVRELLVLMPFPIIGFLLSKLKPTKIFLLLGFIGNLIVTFSYNIDDVWVYLIPSYFFLSMLTAIGIDEILSRLNARKKKFFIVFTIIIPLIFISLNYQRNDMSKDTVNKIYIENILSAINRNGLIINPSYDKFEYLKYYLLGEELGSKENIQMISFDEAQSFLSNNDPKSVSSLPIYSLEDDQANDLVNLGYCIHEISPDFYEIMNCSIN
ncbi:MAG: hypothetical protein C0410_12845 [Anaerolinea sp.]|nr:hypothetical protein [Anaerolinea sp.]